MRLKNIFMCMVLAGGILCGAGCNREADKQSGIFQSTSAADHPAILRMMTMGTEPECGMDAVYEQLDPLTIRDLGCTVRVDFYPWGDETELMKRIIASREYDIYGTGSWGNYEELARRNAFLQLDGWLDLVPGLVQTMELEDGNLLDSVRVDGKVYAIPRKVSQSGGYGFFYREDLRREWGLEPVDSLDMVEAYLYRAAKEFPEYAMINDKRFFNSLKLLLFGEDYYMAGEHCCVRRDDPGTVLCIYDCPEYLEGLKTANKWYKDGVVAQDILMVQQNNTMPTLELMKAGKIPLEFSNHLTAISNNYILPILDSIPDCELGWLDYDWVTNSKFKQYITCSAGQMLAISASTSEPEKSIRLIEKMYTDQNYYDLFVYGAEGVNYQLTGDGRVTYDGIDTENKLRGQTGLENEDLSRQIRYPDAWNNVITAVEEKIHEQTEKNGVYYLDGFSIDSSGMKELVEKLDDIYSYQIVPLECGISADCEKDLKNIRRELDNAGFSLYLKEVQMQLARYISERKYDE